MKSTMLPWKGIEKMCTQYILIRQKRNSLMQSVRLWHMKNMHVIITGLAGSLEELKHVILYTPKSL